MRKVRALLFIFSIKKESISKNKGESRDEMISISEFERICFGPISKKIELLLEYSEGNEKPKILKLFREGRKKAIVKIVFCNEKEALKFSSNLLLKSMKELKELEELEIDNSDGESEKLSFCNDDKKENRFANQLKLLTVSGKESLENFRVISLNRSLKEKFVNSNAEEAFKVFKKTFACVFESKFPNFSLSHRLVFEFGIKLLAVFVNCNVLLTDVNI